MRSVALLTLTALACRPEPVRPPDVARLPPPAEIMARIQASGAARRNLRALGRLTYFGDEGRVRLKAAMLVERDARFRFETISPLEQPIDVMACDGERLWLLSKERLREGPASPDNVARLLPLPMHPEEVVDTLLGGVPNSVRFTPASVAYEEPERALWLLSLAAATGETAVVRYDPAAGRVLGLSLLEPGGDVRVSARFEDFEAAGEAGEVPRSITLVMPRRSLEVEIKLREVDVNVALDPALFRLDPPPGRTPEPL